MISAVSSTPVDPAKTPNHDLITRNLDLVERVARHLGLSPLSDVWDDALSEGRLGLVLAAKRFQVDRGDPALTPDARFRAFAYARVRGAICVALDASRTVKRPRGEETAPIFTRPDELTTGSEAEVVAGLDRSRVLAAARDLPPTQRGAVTAAVLRGERTAETTRRTGAPRQTCASRRNAAVQALRSRFGR